LLSPENMLSRYEEGEKIVASQRMLLVGLAFVLSVPVQRIHAEPRVDTQAIEHAMGRAGQMQGDVYKLSFPRTDLSIVVDSIRLQSKFALGSWIAFRPTMGATVAHGDLVLTEDEVGAVVLRLQEDGIKLTALHNHLLRESPKVMYLHFWTEGDAVQIARSLRRALALTKTPLEKPDTAEKTQSPHEEDLSVERIQGILGQKGTVKAGVLSISVPRTETITVSNIELPPSMGMATALNFQVDAAGKVAATGDFVLAAHEVSSVASALAGHGIQITALHNHLVHSTPELYFMHFWAHDSPERVARGLRAGLDAMKGNP
jgi:hypothetical protein